MKTFRSSGVTFHLVNDFPTDVKNKFLKVVNEYLMSNEDFSRVDNILKFIGGGACGKVYDLGDGFVLKINHFEWYSESADGEILRDLQGIPFIPKLYCYSDDNRFMVVQKIDGMTTGSYRGEYIINKRLDAEKFTRYAKMVDQLIRERGWLMNDIHLGNCMFDRQGQFWIVDVGLFKPAGEHDYSDELQNLIQEGYRVIHYHNQAYDAKVKEQCEGNARGVA